MEEEVDVHEKLENHEGRLQNLEKHQLEQEKINQDIRNQLTTTELTVVKESGKQQELTQRLLDHVLQNDISTRKGIRDRKMFSLQQMWKLAGVLAGGGSVIYLLIDRLFIGG